MTGVEVRGKARSMVRWLAGAALLGCFNSGSALIGGQVASSNNSQSTVSTVALITPGGTNCTGVIIGAHSIMTAAHCIEAIYKNSDSLKIYFPTFGEQAPSISRANPYRMRSIAYTFRTEQRKTQVPDDKLGSVVKAKNFVDDIAIIIFEGDIPNGDGRDQSMPNYQAVPIATQSYKLYNREPLTLAGFGLDIDAKAGNKRTGEAYYYFNTEYQPKGSFGIVSGINSPRTCQGDSGGPVFSKAFGTHPALLGIVVGGTISISDPIVKGIQERIAKGEKVPYSEIAASCTSRVKLAADVRQYATLIEDASRYDSSLVEVLSGMQKTEAYVKTATPNDVKNNKISLEEFQKYIIEEGKW